MPFNITIDHATSVHGSAHSSLSDEEEDSSGTGVQVSPPSATGSQDYPENFEDGPDGGEWSHVIYPDELNPSDSASRPRTSNQNRPTEATRGGGPRQGARRHPSREHERRRPPASPGSVASSDDYEAYVRGGPDRRYYHQIPSGPPITYAPSSSSGHSYNHYLPPGIPGNQLVPIGAPGPYPYPHQYPPTSHHPGPSFVGASHPPNGPLVHQIQQHGSVPYGGSPYGGSEMYSHTSQGYFPYPQPYPMSQGMIPSPFYNPYQQIHSPVMAPTPPPQPASAPPPPAAEPAKDDGIARLEQLLMEQKLQQEKREAALEKAAQEKAALEERAIRDKEIADMAAKNAAASAKAAAEEKAKEDVAKAREEAATKAAADAKTEAEAKAAEDMAKAKEEAEKQAKEAKEEAEKQAKEAKEEAEKQAKEAKEEADEAMKKAVAAAAAKPPEEKKKPIKFKDAVGRKFSFPFHLCCTWVGMEELIRQAFLHVEVIGPHVAEGHYDLVGPNGEIILPQVWETMVEPDWTITMHMWPMPEPPPPPDPDPPPPDDLLPPPPPAPIPPPPGPSVFMIDPDHPSKKSQRPPKVPGGIAWMAGRSKTNKGLKAGKRPEPAAQHDLVCRVM